MSTAARLASAFLLTKLRAALIVNTDCSACVMAPPYWGKIPNVKRPRRDPGFFRSNIGLTTHFVERMTDPSSSHRTAVEAFRKKRGLSVHKWCQDAGIDTSTLRGYLYGKPNANPPVPPTNSMQYINLWKLAHSQGATVAELMGEALPRDAAMGTVALPYFSAREELGGALVIETDRDRPKHRVPRVVIDNELYGDAKRGAIMDIETDAMAPDLRRGDVACIDRECNNPAKFPGYYCIWNGSAPQIIHLIGSPSGNLRGMAETSTAITQEYDGSTIKFIGRVCWRCGAL